MTGYDHIVMQKGRTGDSRSRVSVHPRVSARHPELTNDDVKAAMRSMIKYQQRSNETYVAIGVDGNSRLVELVYEYDSDSDFFFVYHAMTPPTLKTLRELKLGR